MSLLNLLAASALGISQNELAVLRNAAGRKDGKRGKPPAATSIEGQEVEGVSAEGLGAGKREKENGEEREKNEEVEGETDRASKGEDGEKRGGGLAKRETGGERRWR